LLASLVRALYVPPHGFDPVQIRLTMHAFTLHWFRRKQRAVARFVLAAFCLTWLQVAAMPCVMAAGAGASAPTVAAAAATPPIGEMGEMPAGMVMAPGEHCMYCPPEQAPSPVDTAPDLCAFPHDPQVDSRIAFASAMLAPPPVVVLLVPREVEPAVITTGPAAVAEPRSGTTLAVSFCRFLK
jgi:hypothetical protein